MRDLTILLIHLIATIIKLLGPGGVLFQLPVAA
jgi:hypothetical protein